MITSEIADYLATQGYGTVGTDIIKSYSTDQPDHLVLVSDYVEAPPEFDHDGDLPYLEHPGLQIVVRDRDHATAMTAAQAILVTLSGIKNTTLGGTWYMSIHPKHAPTFLKRDESQRTLIVTNYRVSKALSSS